MGLISRKEPLSIDYCKVAMKLPVFLWEYRKFIRFSSSTSIMSFHIGDETRLRYSFKQLL